MINRFIALVDQPDECLKIRQFKGLPPELTGGKDYRENVAWPRVLIIEERSEGIFLFRFTKNGDCVGDTWHISIEDAQSQATFEYGHHLNEWQGVPESIDDPLTFALEKN